MANTFTSGAFAPPDDSAPPVPVSVRKHTKKPDLGTSPAGRRLPIRLFVYSLSL
ncbi:hypothetical protein ACWGPW_12065 [Paenibacillus chitinolyticus]